MFEHLPPPPRRPLQVNVPRLMIALAISSAASVAAHFAVDWEYTTESALSIVWTLVVGASISACLVLVPAAILATIESVPAYVVALVLISGLSAAGSGAAAASTDAQAGLALLTAPIYGSLVAVVALAIDRFLLPRVRR